ncbi:MAG: TRAP transporter substrate-binding protein [Rhodobacteraceae bacterium]|nr:TRAP transporter substrate-binding protein [Paracoccaceae bacterium]
MLKKSVMALTAIGVMGLTAPVVSAQDYVAKIGHFDPPTTARHLTLLDVATAVSEATDGAVELQIFPSSQLGNPRETIEGIQLGTIEGGSVPAAFLTGFNPAVAIFDIPYVMPNDRELAQKLRTGPFGDAVLDTFADKGFVALDIWANGRKAFTSNKDITNPDSFDDQRFRVMNSNILLTQFDALGASAITLPFAELYTALQNGVVDGQENPLDIIERMRFYEVQNNLYVTDHGAIEDVVIFNPGWWSSLPAEHQETITRIVQEHSPVMDQRKTADEAASLDTLRELGMNVVIAGDEERAEIRNRAYEPAKAAYIERAGDVGQSLITVYEGELAKLQ